MPDCRKSAGQVLDLYIIIRRGGGFLHYYMVCACLGFLSSCVGVPPMVGVGLIAIMQKCRKGVKPLILKADFLQFEIALFLAESPDMP